MSLSYMLYKIVEWQCRIIISDHARDSLTNKFYTGKIKLRMSIMPKALCRVVNLCHNYNKSCYNKTTH